MAKRVLALLTSAILTVLFILPTRDNNIRFVSHAEDTNYYATYIKSLIGTPAKEWGDGEGTQCVELVKYYVEQLWGVSTKKQALGNGNAIYRRVAQEYPQFFSAIDYYDGLELMPGDIISYNSSDWAADFGHAALVYEVNGNSYRIAEQAQGWEEVSSNTKTIQAGVYGVPYTIIGIARPHENTATNDTSVSFHSDSISDITTNDATISTWTTNKNGEIFSTGFWIGTDPESMHLFTTYSHIGWTEFLGEYQLSDYYGNLSPGTTYYYRYYLISEEGMRYYESDIKSFTTDGNANITFDTFESVCESSDTAELSGWTRNSNGYEIKSYGIFIGESVESMEKIEIGYNVAWTDFHTKINIIEYYKQLSPETQYYYRWYAEIDTTYYSDLLSFYTTEDIYPPLIQSFSTEDVTSDGFTLVAKISDNVGVENVTFETWKDGSPDRTTVSANYSHDDYYCYRFSVADFNNKTGVYHAIVYASDRRNTNTQEIDILVPNKTVEGDCNNDGELSVADVVLLQKWLLSVPDTNLVNWQAADLYEDGVIDVFDLCLMKRKLING